MKTIMELKITNGLINKIGSYKFSKFEDINQIKF